MNLNEEEWDDDQFITAKTGILDIENHVFPAIVLYSDCLKVLLKPVKYCKRPYLLLLINGYRWRSSIKTQPIMVRHKRRKQKLKWQLKRLTKARVYATRRLATERTVGKSVNFVWFCPFYAICDFYNATIQNSKQFKKVNMQYDLKSLISIKSPVNVLRFK